MICPATMTGIEVCPLTRCPPVRGTTARSRAMRNSMIKALGAIAVACATTGSFGQALDPFTFPAGVGCDFPLTVQPLAVGTQAIRVEADKTRTGMVVTA